MKSILFKIKMQLSFVAIILLIANSEISCKKDIEQIPDNSKGEINFTFQISESAIKKELKSTEDVTDIGYIAVSIIDEKGDRVIDFLTFELFNMNGYYISKPLSLTVGKYSISDFLVLDKNKNVVYATPKSNSKLAYLVKQPLPVNFEVKKDNVLKIAPEVLKITSNPSDYGYVTFSFTSVDAVNILVGVFIYDESIKNFKLTNADLSISSDINTNNFKLENKTNAITLSLNANSYKFEIMKEGYQSWKKSFTNDELKNMKEPLIVILEQQSFECAVSWSNFFGTKDMEHGNQAIQTADKGTILIGSSYHFDSGVERMYIVKTNCKGELEWEKFYTEMASGNTIVKTQDESYVICGQTTHSGGMSVIKIDSKGNKLWLKNYQNSNTLIYPNSFLSKDNGFFLTAYYYSGNSEKCLLIKTDESGNELWRVVIAELNKKIVPFCIKETDDGNMYFLYDKSDGNGSFSSNMCLSFLDKNGNTKWNKEYPRQITQYAKDMIITDNNSILILGTENYGGNTTSPSVLLFSVDMQGNKLWEKRYKSYANNNYMGANANSICKATDGNYFVLGTTNLEEDIYVLKIDQQGNVLYEKTFGGINYIVNGNSVCVCGQDAATKISPTIDGGCLVSGVTTNFGSGLSDAFVLKLDKDGNGIFGKGKVKTN